MRRVEKQQSCIKVNIFTSGWYIVDICKVSDSKNALFYIKLDVLIWVCWYSIFSTCIQSWLSDQRDYIFLSFRFLITMTLALNLILFNTGMGPFEGRKPTDRNQLSILSTFKLLRVDETDFLIKIDVDESITWHMMTIILLNFYPPRSQATWGRILPKICRVGTDKDVDIPDTEHTDQLGIGTDLSLANLGAAATPTEYFLSQCVGKILYLDGDFITRKCKYDWIFLTNVWIFSM